MTDVKLNLVHNNADRNLQFLNVILTKQICISKWHIIAKFS